MDKNNNGPPQNKRLLWLLLLGVVAFNIADYVLTLYALRLGFREANPFMYRLIGTPWFAKVKLLAVPALLLILWLLRRRVGGRLHLYAWVAFIAYALLMLYYASLFWRGYL